MRGQQRFHRVAGRVALGFGVVGDRGGHLQIGAVIDVHVADAVEVLDDGDFRFLGDARGQRFAAARDDDVDKGGHREHLADGRAVGDADQLHCVCRQASGGQALQHRRVDRPIALDCLGAAAQDAGIASHEAERRRVGRHVGARFVDHADHAQRHAHPAQFDPRWAARQFRDDADRVGQRGYLRKAIDHSGNRRIRQRQPVDEGGVAAGGPGALHVVPVGFAYR
jgi:hypothetical protein